MVQTLEEQLHVPRGLSLELTLKCNQFCKHCYNSSGPHQDTRNDLSREDFLRLLEEGSKAGFESLQLSGGEVMMSPYLAELMLAAKGKFPLIEVYSNLTQLTDSVVSAAKIVGAGFATSFYSPYPGVHDVITGYKGKETNHWHAIVSSIQRILKEKLHLRVGVIEHEENKGHLEETVEFLLKLGVERIKLGRVLPVGRAENYVHAGNPKDGLCGRCCYGSLTVNPQGKVYPCSMGRAFIVGDVRQSSLVAIADSNEAASLRKALYDHFKQNFAGNRCSSEGHSGRSSIKTKSLGLNNKEIEFYAGCPGNEPGGCGPDIGDSLMKAAPIYALGK